MQHQYALLRLKDETGLEQCALKLSLWQIAQGPMHHEYNVTEKAQGFKGKIAFNLIMK